MNIQEIEDAEEERLERKYREQIRRLWGKAIRIGSAMLCIGLVSIWAGWLVNVVTTHPAPVSALKPWSMAEINTRMLRADGLDSYYQDAGHFFITNVVRYDDPGPYGDAGAKPESWIQQCGDGNSYRGPK